MHDFIKHSLPYPNSSAALFERFRHLPLPIMLSSGQTNESEATIANNNRFDIICAAPGKVLRTSVNTGNANDNSLYETIIESTDGSKSISTDKPMELLRKQFNFSKLGAVHEANIPFAGGALGYFSYELLHPKLGINPSTHSTNPKLPEMLVGIYHWAIIVDHQEKTCFLILRPQCHLSLEELLFCIERTPDKQKTSFALRQNFTSNFTFDQYKAAYDKVIDYIYAGDCYQVNLTQRFSAQYQGDAFRAFEKLQDRVNAPFAAYIEDSEHVILSFSPERFLKVNDKAVLTEPIKGTRPRHNDPAQDKANLEELQSSVKDKAENLMIVDLLRNDIGRVCKTGSVSVDKLFAAHSFANVHHLISTVKGELTKSSDVFKLFEASFPGGSITGTPKIRSMEIINELETRSRSVYCGSIAYFDFNGNMDSNIGIRSLVGDGENLHCWGGGAVVVDSTVEQEYQESIDKISIFMNGLEE